MEQRTCVFCGNPLEPGSGKMFVRRDGSVYYFDRRRCQMNYLEFGRQPRATKWTRHYPRQGTVAAEAALAKEEARAAVAKATGAEAAAEEEPAAAAPAAKKSAAKKPVKKATKAA